MATLRQAVVRGLFLGAVLAEVSVAQRGRAPSNLALPFVSTQGYGCSGDGVSDDTSCIQNAFNAITDPVSRFGRKLLIASGSYRLTRTIMIANVTGPVIEGAGASTTFLWAGPPNIPMFHFANVRDAAIRDFRIQTSQTTRLQEGIRIDNTTKNAVDPGHNTWESISMEGTNGNIGVCFREPNGGQDANNDLQLYVNNRCSNYSGAAWSIEHSQALSSYFLNNQCYGNKHGQVCVGGNLAGTAGALANFYWHGGFGSSNAKADFYINSAQQGTTIQDFTSEGSNRFLITDGPSAATLSITVDNLRWASYGLNTDGEFIVYRYPGPFVLRNSTKLGDSYRKAMKINWSPLAGGARRSFAIENSTLVGSNTTMASIFTNQIATSLQGFSVQNSDTKVTSLDAGGRGATRVATPGDFNAAGWEEYVGVTDTSRARTVKLANLDITPEPEVGRTITIKDESGGAEKNNITVLVGGRTTRVDGGTSATINTNYGFRTLMYLGNKAYAVVGSK